MTLPDGLNKYIVRSVVSLLLLQSLKAQLLHAVVRNILCPYKHIIFILKQQGEKKKAMFLSYSRSL